MKTIAAISTPPGRGAVSMIRISGPDAHGIAKRVFTPAGKVEYFEPRKMYLGKINCGSYYDTGLCVFFNSPRSYTGEDMAEIYPHGGTTVTADALTALLDSGAVMAKPGEFSRRALLNGKMSITEAEGVIDMIDAQNSAHAAAGSSLVRGNLNTAAKELQDKVADMLAQIDAALDYPEEHEELSTVAEIHANIDEIIKKLDRIIATRKTGAYLSSGVNISIAGRVNVGKSSLLNALLEYGRAIVTPHPGTTRDTITESYIYKNVKFNLTDTAGFRQANDEIEKLGIERSLLSVRQSDIVLIVIDKADPDIIKTYQDETAGKKVLVVKNKGDLNPAPEGADIVISAKTGQGIEQLKDRIYKIFIDEDILSSDIILTNARHYSALVEARKALARSKESDQYELIADDLKAAWDALGLITGATVSEDLIDLIFSKFCLGK